MVLIRAITLSEAAVRHVFSAAMAGFMFLAAPVSAGHKVITEDDLAYPGTIVVADGHGKVDVRVIYLAQEECWKIVSARPGLPNKTTDQPTDRHLYVTVAIEKTGQNCAVRNTPLETRLAINDKPGTLSLDILFVDERGVYQRSQRHRIQRD